MVEPTIVVVFVFNFFSLAINTFGIYCLQVQRGGNINQRLLLQNLSAIEIIKIINDYVSFTSYFLYSEWYEVNMEYFDLAEMHLLTVFYFSLIFISMERLACIILNLRYKALVTNRFIRWAIIITWISAFLPGFIFWMIHCTSSKDSYYLVFDILIPVITTASYAIIGIIYRRSRLTVIRGSRNPSKQLKVVQVPFLIVTMFVISNCVPDIIFAFYKTPDSYNISIVMWSLGFITDPCVYIFINKRTRIAAGKTFERHGCYNTHYGIADIINSFRRRSIRLKGINSLSRTTNGRSRSRSQTTARESLV